VIAPSNNEPEKPLTSLALKQLIDLQRSMYEKALVDARESSGADSTIIATYQKEFEASLPDQFTSIPVRKLLESIDENPVILFGDFHSHKQSQRAFLRLMRMYRNRPDHAPIVVALEMFRSDDQQHLNAWLAGHIEDDEFLDLVDYDNSWGFPWTNYKPILEYCKYQGIPAVGINSRRSGKDPMDKRDEYAANVIMTLRRNAPNARIFCMIGEFHLANGKLPKKLLELGRSNHEKTPLRVYVNLDKYFFALKPDRLHRSDEYLELAPDSFCVINSPPWIKWQSQALWEETRRLGSIKYLMNSIAPDDFENDLDVWDEGDDDLYEESLDLDYHIRQLQTQIAGFFGLKTVDSLTDSFHILTDTDSEYLENMQDTVRASLLDRANRDGFAINYNAQILYMPDVTINNMAAATGQVLMGNLCGLRESSDANEHQFVTECLKYTFGFIANKILNPRLPLHNKKQLEAYVLSTRGRRLAGLTRQRRDSAKEALKLYGWIARTWKSGADPKRKIAACTIEIDARSSHSVAKNLGQLIAEPICLAIVKGRLDTTDLRRWLTNRCHETMAAKKSLAALISLSVI
jgi:hypothetical protein